MEHLFIHLLFLFIRMYNSILKFYCKELYCFIIKYTTHCFAWEGEEMDHKISSLFFPNFKFLQIHCNTTFFFLRIAWSRFLQYFLWSEVATNGMGRRECHATAVPNLEWRVALWLHFYEVINFTSQLQQSFSNWNAAWISEINILE